MSNKKIQQLVQSQLADSGALSPNSLHPVSIRLDPADVAQLDVLASYLGYKNRSQLLRQIVESSLEDLVIEVRKSLKSDATVSAQFKEDLTQALHNAG